MGGKTKMHLGCFGAMQRALAALAALIYEKAGVGGWVGHGGGRTGPTSPAVGG